MSEYQYIPFRSQLNVIPFTATNEYIYAFPATSFIENDGYSANSIHEGIQMLTGLNSDPNISNTLNTRLNGSFDALSVRTREYMPIIQSSDTGIRIDSSLTGNGKTGSALDALKLMQFSP